MKLFMERKLLEITILFVLFLQVYPIPPGFINIPGEIGPHYKGPLLPQYKNPGTLTAVNGGWSKWTEYGECTKTCGDGQRERTRRCDNPAPKYGGKYCAGGDSETDRCNTINCPINGGWSEWTEYGDCTKTCGDGQRKRTRRCDNPEPKSGGEYCSGSDTETDRCNTMNCPINGRWGEWSTSCSSTCGKGIYQKIRKCDNPTPKFGGLNCRFGYEAIVIGLCQLKDCPDAPYWGAWSKFSKCSATCGHGYKTRTRDCFVYFTKVFKEKCSGINVSYDECEVKQCVSAAMSQSNLSIGGIVAITVSALIVVGASIAFIVYMKKNTKK